MNLTGLDTLIDEIIVDAYGEDEQLGAFRQALEDAVPLPVYGVVIGVPVSVIAFDYDGNERRGLTAQCRRENGSKHVVAVAELEIPTNEKLARYVAAYRKWMGLAPYMDRIGEPTRREPRRKSLFSDLDLTLPGERNSPTKAEYICADQLANFTFRLQRSGGPYICSGAHKGSQT